jgi:hypothetical protein
LFTLRSLKFLFFSQHSGKPLYPGSSVSDNETTLLIFGFVIRHELSESCTNDLLKLLKIILPLGASSPPNSYFFKKALDFDYTNATKNFYCKICESFMGSKVSDACVKCNSKDSQENSENFFLSFNLKHSISSLLQIEEIKSSIAQTFKTRRDPVSTIKDISDGKKYRELNLGEHDLTMTMNTDGVPVFKSSKLSLWPVLLSINELSYPLRRKFVILAGLWFGSSKPNFDTFLTPFVEQCRLLSHSGIQWELKGEIIQSFVFFPMLVADSPARCQVQGIKQYNGKFSCTWCLIPGRSFTNHQNERSHKWIFPPIKAKNVRKRCHETFLLNLQQLQNKLASGESDSEFGIKTASKLLLVPKFDIVYGFVFDIMHVGFLGIARRLLNLWTDTSMHCEDFYIGRKIKEIDEKFLRVLVPSDTHRTARSISDRKFWKATEWRTWMIVAPIILDGILKEKYLNHFRLFSSSILMLSRSKIQIEELDWIENNLFRFVARTKKLYGLEYCSYNNHLLIHAAECVKNWGPLFAYSAFQFEDYNGIFLNFFHGTQYVPTQITNRVQEILCLRMLQSSSFHDFAAREFFFQILENRKCSKRFEAVGEVKFYGKMTNHKFTSRERQCLEIYGINSSEGNRYDKAIFHGTLYSSHPKRTTKRCNSIIMMNGAVKIIWSFFSVCDETGKTQALASVSNILTRKVNKFTFGYKILKIQNETEMILIQNIEQVKFLSLMNNSDLSFVIKLPNLIEIE